MNPSLHIVWFKRDLRAADHRALVIAAAQKPVLPLFIAEPAFWQLPDSSARHWAFVRECLIDLRRDLAALGQPLVVRVGAAPRVLEQLHADYGVASLHSHEETGNAWTYARDRQVAAWCRTRSIPWHQVRQNGVVRRLPSRNGWAKNWDRFMGEAVVAPPALAPLRGIEPGAIPSAQDLGLEPDPCGGRQAGGREAGLERLGSFLDRRSENYRAAMASPSTAAEACSRLSPYLAWGAVSAREVAQATWARQRALKTAPKAATESWRKSLISFSGRLHWRCHFAQKLEDEPRLEFENLHGAYDGLRPAEPDRQHLSAWEKGQTGLPFIDACMRALCAEGWMNFRMRAMLMAFASYHLWLDWRQPGEHLARLFTDYDPGIHWPQVQMQSGTTGINTVRVYNPIKQSYDQDPKGAFLRRWLPELGSVPEAFVHEPWRWEKAGSVLGRSYPFPIIDHLAAAKQARRKVWMLRHSADYRAAADTIQEKHGSRKSGIARAEKQRRKPAAAPTEQLSLALAGDDPR